MKTLIPLAMIAGLLVLAGCVTNAPITPAGVAGPVPRVEVGGTEATATTDLRQQLREQREREQMLAGYTTDSTRTSLEQNAQRGRLSAVDDWISSYLFQQLQAVTAANTQTQAEGLAQSARSVAQGYEDLSQENRRLLEAIEKVISTKWPGEIEAAGGR